MNWEYQGRQRHGYFGHGTSPHADEPDGSSDDAGLGSIASRARSVAMGVIGALPARERGRGVLLQDEEGLARQARVLASWGRGVGLGRARFADRFLDRAADDPVSEAAWRVGRGVAEANTHEALREASEAYAALIERIGPDRLPRFLEEAEERSRSFVAATSAKRGRDRDETSSPPDPGGGPFEGGGRSGRWAAEGAAMGAATGAVMGAAGEGALGATGGSLVAPGAGTLAGGLGGAMDGAAKGAAIGGVAGATLGAALGKAADLAAISNLRGAPAHVMMSKPPDDARNPYGAKAPGKPGKVEGFENPKEGESWVRSPNGRGYGWLAKDGAVWVPTGSNGKAHGGPHWDVQRRGGYQSVYPGGKRR